MIDPLLRRLEEVEQQVGTLALEVEDMRRQVVARSTRPQLLAGFFYQRLSASSDRAAL